MFKAVFLLLLAIVTATPQTQSSHEAEFIEYLTKWGKSYSD